MESCCFIYTPEIAPDTFHNTYSLWEICWLVRIGVVNTNATKIKIHFFLECFHSKIKNFGLENFLPCSHVLLVCCPPTLTYYDGVLTLLYQQTFQSLTLCNFETHRLELYEISFLHHQNEW